MDDKAHMYRVPYGKAYMEFELSYGMRVAVISSNPVEPLTHVEGAIADALSDSLGIHIAKESITKNSTRAVWEATFATFLSKFVISMTFVIPLLLFALGTAIVVSIVWGLSLLGIFSYFIAKEQNKKPWHVILEHIAIAILVVYVTFNFQAWIKQIFN